MHTIDDIEVAGRRVLLRSGLNVPPGKSGSGVVTDDGRIRAGLPVIRRLAGRGGRAGGMVYTLLAALGHEGKTLPGLKALDA